MTVDDFIPFCEYFVIPYFLWFAYVAIGILYFALNNKKEVLIKYFIKDIKKQGGKYSEKTGVIKKYDQIKQMIIFYDKTQIEINNVVEISDLEKQ